MRILVVDDSRTMARQLTKMLENLGHQVVGHASTGAEAVKLFEEVRPELVFLDLVMPQLDGLSALRAMRQLDGQAPIIVVSSVGGVGANVADALKLGAREVLSKPFQLADIAHAVARIQDRT